MNRKITRRDLFRLITAVTGATGLTWFSRWLKMPSVGAQSTPPGPINAYLPAVLNSSASTPTPTKTPTPTPTHTPNPPYTSQIIADHTIMDHYQNIPQYYIDQVKKMWVNIPGESHSAAYRIGCQLLQNQDSRFKVNRTESGPPESYTDQHLRISRATWGDVANPTGWCYGYGEEDWFTSTTAVQRTKGHLNYCNSNNLQIAAMGFGWCWDMEWGNAPGGGIDPEYQVQWAGTSNGGPDGNKRWGLDSGDYSLTQNHVCMDTYLDATQQYITYCRDNNFPTRIFFTTGPVDSSYNTGESGYQRHIKHEYIRNSVRSSSDRILFDYADILCWSDAGQQKTLIWTDHAGRSQTFPYIHDNNMLDLNGSYTEDGDHIGQRGALRLSKALWWMLARLAGWDGQ